MEYSRKPELVAGAIAGLLGGLALAGIIYAQGMMGTVSGLLGLRLGTAGLVLHLLLAVLLGATFGTIVRYQRGGGYAALSNGLLWGLLWWIAGPLTLAALLHGHAPNWSLAEAGQAFPDLVGNLLYGGVTGLGFYVLAMLYDRARPQPVASPATTQGPKKQIVILGGGFGGVSTAQRLEQLLVRDPSVEITLVSQSNYLLFTPMLAEVASSGLEAQHISAPVRAALTRTTVRRAAIEAIDANARLVLVRSGDGASVEKLAYDHLVLALGSEPNFYGLPGLQEHSWTLKSLADAIRLRNHVIALLEQADAEPDPEERRRQLSFVVAGAGFAGTETIAELFDLVHSVLRYYPNLDPDEPRFVLVHSGERILPELSSELSAYALHKLRARGIEFLLNTRVAGATRDAVLLGTNNSIPTRTLVWTAGNQPNPILKSLPVPQNRPGAVIADATLRVEGCANIWAVGDCAQIPDVYQPGKFHPPTAQHALREGKVLAENIVAALSGKPLKRFRFRTIGMLVVLGHRTAAAEIRGWKFSGLLAWFMWRTIYLGKLPGLEKKVRVALDWTIDLFFPRDIVLTGPAPLPANRPATTNDHSDRAVPQPAVEAVHEPIA